MATLSTHTLDGTDGTHAGGIGVTLARIPPDEGRVHLLSGQTDEGGRFSDEIDPERHDLTAAYELIFDTGRYWASKGIGAQNSIVSEIVVRISMPNANARYHIPVILSPNTYSIWWSGLPRGPDSET